VLSIEHEPLSSMHPNGLLGLLQGDDDAHHKSGSLASFEANRN
jgi:hypothetical protein